MHSPALQRANLRAVFTSRHAPSLRLESTILVSSVLACSACNVNVSGEAGANIQVTGGSEQTSTEAGSGVSGGATNSWGADSVGASSTTATSTGETGATTTSTSGWPTTGEHGTAGTTGMGTGATTSGGETATSTVTSGSESGAVTTTGQAESDATANSEDASSEDETSSSTDSGDSGEADNGATGDDGPSESTSTSETGANDEGSGSTTDSTSTSTSTGSSSSSTTTSGGGDSAGDDTSDDTGDHLELLRELTAAICDWGYNCCEEGELDYILGPFVKDEEDCSLRLYQLLTVSHDSSVDEDDRKLALLGNDFRRLPFDLAHRIRLDRSNTLETGLRGCIQAWKNDDCREPAAAHASSCEDDPIDRACQLDKLFVGTLGQSEHCNWQLKGPHSDIECAPGFTCEASLSGSVDDPQTYRCVFKGQEGDLCTLPEWHDDTTLSAPSNGACEWGLYCDDDTGRCKERPGVGDRCEYHDPDFPQVDQMHVPCQHDLYCDPKTKRCVDECSEGYGCGPRTAVGLVARGRHPATLSDDRLLQYPTEDFIAPSDPDDRCGANLSCTPYRNHPSGSDASEAPGDAGYYFGRGTDRYGTSFECRAPGGNNALCDTKADCRSGYYCEKAATTRRQTSALPHQHDSGGKGSFAEVGRCTAELNRGDRCFEPGDDELDFDLRADQLSAHLDQADARCPEGHFCDLSDDSKGRCTEKLRINELCYRHSDCDPVLTAGLCLVSGNDPASAAKRCAPFEIKQDQLCAPRAGLGSNAPFPIVLRGGSSDPSSHEKIIAPGHGMLAYEVDPTALRTRANADPDDYREFPATHGVDSSRFPELWQGPRMPAVQPETGHIFSSDRFVRVGQADVSGDSVFADGQHPGDLANVDVPAGFADFHAWWGQPSDQPFATSHPFGTTGVDISGGEYGPYAWMQGQAMILHRDLSEWEHNNDMAEISFEPRSNSGDEPTLDSETTHSDFRHLASHCDSKDPRLVCRRDPSDDAGGNPFRCLVGVGEGSPCGSDPGSFGPGKDLCQPGLECYDGYCKPHARTGDECTTKDTGDDSFDRIVRCDWRHRAPIYARVPCPSPASGNIQCKTGRDAGGRRASWLIDPLDGEFVEYIAAWDNGCEKVHRSSMCRLISENAHDTAYCDGRNGQPGAND